MRREDYAKHSEGKELKATWKSSGTNEVEVRLPLKDVAIGAATLTVKQFGIIKPDELKLHTYSEAAKLDDFSISVPATSWVS